MSLAAAMREDRAAMLHPGSELQQITARFPSDKLHKVHDIQRLSGASVTAMIVDYEREVSVRGKWYSHHIHYFDMVLTRRPAGARGYFTEAPEVLRPVGQILFAPAGHPYDGRGGPGRQKTLTIFIDPRKLMGEAPMPNIRPVLSRCMALQASAVHQVLQQIAREVAEPGFASELMLASLALNLLVETTRALLACQAQNLRKGGLSQRNLKAIDERLKDNAGLPSLNELAALCRLSPRQLVRAFRAETGQTIGAYVQQIMMDRAREYLLTSSMPIAEIAAQIGFVTTSGFSTAFRRAIGESPSNFRSSHAA